MLHLILSFVVVFLSFLPPLGAELCENLCKDFTEENVRPKVTTTHLIKIISLVFTLLRCTEQVLKYISLSRMFSPNLFISPLYLKVQLWYLSLRDFRSLPLFGIFETLENLNEY